LALAQTGLPPVGGNRVRIHPEVTVHFILSYDYVPDDPEKRTPDRAAHLAHAESMQEAGPLFMAGAFDPPSDGPLFVLQADCASEIEPNPYVTNGVATGWRVKPWKVVIGS